MALKKLLLRLALLLINIAIIGFLWVVGWRAIIGFCLGVFVGACVVVYWEYSKNSWMSYVLKDVMKDGKQKAGNNKRKN